METDKTFSPAACKAIEFALERHFQAAVQIIKAQNIPLSQVYRCNLQSSDETVPDTVIVRFPRAGTVRSSPDLLSRECAALTYLAAREGVIAPRFYTGGVSQGYIVSEDLGTDPALLDLLLGKDHKAAEAGALSFARTLGRLHAATLAGAGSHYRPELAHERSLVEESWERVRKAADSLGLPRAQDVEHDIVSIARTLHSDTAWLALSSGDPSVVNCKVTPSGVRFFDFESACFRHALMDAVVLHFFYPTGGPPWQIPEDLTRHMEEAYRAELPVSDDSQYATARNAACAAWMLLRLERLPRVDAGPDRDPWTLLPPDWSGPAPVRSRRRQLVSIIETWVTMANRADAFGDLVEWCERLVDTLRSRWPEAAEERPVYPAFQPMP